LAWRSSKEAAIAASFVIDGDRENLMADDIRYAIVKT